MTFPNFPANHHTKNKSCNLPSELFTPLLGNALIPSHADTIRESSLLLLPLLLPPLLDQPLNGFAVGGEPVRGLPSAVLAAALRTLKMNGPRVIISVCLKF